MAAETTNSKPATVEMAEFNFKPIGYLRSPFSFKNGTPRQATVCSEARGIIRIEKTIFTNPEHSLEGLQMFSHIWIMFIFHKNNCQHRKAKVRPPRLNGERVGVFSTRSPYRPNNIGLSLAKLEKVEGASVTVSGIDILDGTPIVDIKPYIAQYDYPGNFPVTLQAAVSSRNPTESLEIVTSTAESVADLDLDLDLDSSSSVADTDSCLNKEPVKTESNEVSGTFVSGISTKENHGQNAALSDRSINRVDPDGTAPSGSTLNVEASNCLAENLSRENASHESPCNDVPSSIRPSVEIEKNDRDKAKQDSSTNITSVENKASIDIDKSGTLSFTVPCSKTSSGVTEKNEIESSQSNTALSSTAEWITSPPVATLRVLFTPRALDQLRNFTTDSKDARFRLKFMQSSEEVQQAIVNILHEDPRSVYRRKKCTDSLYYFTVDVVHVTCWFDSDDVGDGDVKGGCVEVVGVKPASDVDQCKHEFSI